MVSLFFKNSLILLTSTKTEVQTTPNTVKQNVEYAPCRKACPAGINVQGYIALIAQGKFEEALELIRKYIPFPLVCGRVCFSPCEDACTRKNIDEALSIRALKRLVADYENMQREKKKPKKMLPTHSEKIAVIGSGPAGLTAAYELVKMGYPVIVFEKSSYPGGMLRECIPEYRLPKKVLDVEIDYIKALGVEIRANTTVGKDVTFEELKRKYKAIFIATGAEKCYSLNVEGEALNGVFHSHEFLKDVTAGKQVSLGDKVVVIGGGNVAIDAARTAKRLGAKDVTIVYRRSEEEMPAHGKEVEEAKIESMKFHFLATPKKILGKDGKVVGIECVKMELGEPDETGRRRPIPVEGSEFAISTDNVIIAIGETTDTSFLPSEIQVTKRSIVADNLTLETTLPAVFAGGDAVTGPASVIEAIAAGKKAAVSIDRCIKGQDLRSGREEKIVEKSWVSEETVLEKKPRQKMPTLLPEQRVGNFSEVELGFDPVTGIREAVRCLACGPCEQCLEKEELCEPHEIFVIEDECIGCANCEKTCWFGAIKVEKSIAKINPFLCKGCGTCVVECPELAINMKDFTNENILESMRNVKWDGEGNPRILVFSCERTSNLFPNPTQPLRNVNIIQMPCAGRIDQTHVLQAFSLGVDGVLIFNCNTKDCHYGNGSLIAEKRTRQMKKWLKELGIESERLQMASPSLNEKEGLNEAIDDFLLSLKKMDINPLRKLA